jgi:hypothetical protein
MFNPHIAEALVATRQREIERAAHRGHPHRESWHEQAIRKPGLRPRMRREGPGTRLAGLPHMDLDPSLESPA